MKKTLKKYKRLMATDQTSLVNIDIENNYIVFKNYENNKVNILTPNNYITLFFELKTLSKILGYSRTNKAIEVIQKYVHVYKDLVEKYPTITQINGDNNKFKLKFTTERGLYKLIFNSRKPFAEEISDELCDLITLIRQEKIAELKTISDRVFNINRELKEVTKELHKEKTIKDKIINKFELFFKSKIITPQSENKQTYFIICKLNLDNYKYDYYSIRCQKANIMTAFNNLKNTFPDIEILHEWIDPNPISIFNSIKTHDKIESLKNYFNLKDGLTIDELIRFINNIKTKLTTLLTVEELNQIMNNETH